MELAYATQDHDLVRWTQVELAYRIAARGDSRIRFSLGSIASNRPFLKPVEFGLLG
jgi:hypothetical protein